MQYLPEEKRALYLLANCKFKKQRRTLCSALQGMLGCDKMGFILEYCVAKSNIKMITFDYTKRGIIISTRLG
jgi:hypothetical protein